MTNSNAEAFPPMADGLPQVAEFRTHRVVDRLARRGQIGCHGFLQLVHRYAVAERITVAGGPFGTALADPVRVLQPPPRGALQARQRPLAARTLADGECHARPDRQSDADRHQQVRRQLTLFRPPAGDAGFAAAPRVRDVRHPVSQLDRHAQTPLRSRALDPTRAVFEKAALCRAA